MKLTSFDSPNKGQGFDSSQPSQKGSETEEDEEERRVDQRTGRFRV